jgi:hypothetical protein
MVVSKGVEMTPYFFVWALCAAAVRDRCNPETGIYSTPL